MAVSYTRTTWKNRVVQHPRTYEESEQSYGIVHTPAPGTVTQTGTPLNEDNLNNIETGIVNLVAALNQALETIDSINTTLIAYNTRIATNANDITSIQRVNATQTTDIANLETSHNALAADEGELKTQTNAHISNTSNPHHVTKAQIGLGNVQNVSTNNQRPSYTEGSEDEQLENGETLSEAFGKIAHAVRRLWAHISNTSNPHSVTKEQVGLGNVLNLTINNQTPSYGTITDDQELQSGETLSVAFGKIQRAIARLYNHIDDTSNPHNTGLFDVMNVTLNTNLTEPDVIGQFIGTGLSKNITIENEHNPQQQITVKGQLIDLGFAPSKVAIILPGPETQTGCSEIEAAGISLLNIIANAYGIATIGPGQNYYHSLCGSTYKTATPYSLLYRKHGGACVYGNGFIAATYVDGNNAPEAPMYINLAGVTYTYFAWR